MLHKNPTLVQYAIPLAQKKDAELCIVEVLHNHDAEHEINHSSSKQYQGQNSNPGCWHGCIGPHLIRD